MFSRRSPQCQLSTKTKLKSIRYVISIPLQCLAEEKGVVRPRHSFDLHSNLRQTPQLTSPLFKRLHLREVACTVSWRPVDTETVPAADARYEKPFVLERRRPWRMTDAAAHRVLGCQKCARGSRQASTTTECHPMRSAVAASAHVLSMPYTSRSPPPIMHEGPPLAALEATAAAWTPRACAPAAPVASLRRRQHRAPRLAARPRPPLGAAWEQDCPAPRAA